MKFFRLFTSALVAFGFYAGWAYFANSLVTTEQSVLIKAALVQGLYSGAVTLFFTLLLEFFHARFSQSSLCLSCIVPRWSHHSKKQPCTTIIVFEENLAKSQKKCHGARLPGMLMAPMPALLIQGILVISINLMFNTPNLWLTVAPSIIFSAIYGYSYSIALSKSQSLARVTNA